MWGIIKNHILWLEEEPARPRKYILMVNTYTWLISLLATSIAGIFDYDLLQVLYTVTAQYSATILFYMQTNAKSDNHGDKHNDNQ